MSSSLKIDEGLIASGKFGSSKSSRENSSERRGRQSLPDSYRSIGNGPNKRTTSRDSSSDYSSSRDSSLDSKSKLKADKEEKTDKCKNISQLNGATIVKKKRGRPKSLDLSSKTVVNGDDDKFKSPDPLTPCNVFVKRRKGRPKETPPTLVAETPVGIETLDGTSVDLPVSDIEAETADQEKDVEIPKRKSGRLPKVDKGKKVSKVVSVKKAGKRGKFGLKRNINKLGFRKLTKMKTSVISYEPELNSVSQAKDGTESVSGQNNSKDAEAPVVVKRKPGRPPGAKNKPKSHLNHLISTTRKAKLNKVSLLSEKGKLKLITKKRGPSKKSKRIISETLKNSNMENANSVSIQTEIDGTLSLDENKFTESNDENKVNGENKMLALDGSLNTNGQTKPQIVFNEEVSKNLDEAINAVVFKASNDLPLFTRKHGKKRLPSKLGLKRSVVPPGKLKKIKDMVHRVRKRRLMTQHKHLDGRTVDVLAPNDLRRKLHEKVLQKMHMAKSPVFPDFQSDKVKDSKSEVHSSESVKKEVAAFKTNVFYSQSEQKPISVNERLGKSYLKGRKQSVDMGDLKRYSDTESICSEISSTSFNSLKRPAEKQIIVLGEDNIDSDDSSIRTRQRFDIVPGKKRKRTLSGEFDLLDEKQLRKERKLAEKGIDHENVFFGSEGTKETGKMDVKYSPKLKLRNKEKQGTTFKARKVQLLKQSPFLTYKTRKRKGYKRNKKIRSPLKNLKADSDAAWNKNAYTHEPYMFHSATLSKPEIQRKSLFEQFNDFSNTYDLKELQPLSLKQLCENVISAKEGKVKNEMLQSESEAVVSSLLSEIIDRVVYSCESGLKTDRTLLDDKDFFQYTTSDLIGVSRIASSGESRRPWRRRRPGQSKRQKLGPLPIPRKSQTFEPKRAPRGRKKGVRGRMKSTARKTNISVETKTSPDLLTTRKFELRQKISRSPLDNIALKQSLEETKYLKAEQQRAIRKEIKLKSKLKASNQDSMDSTCSDISEVTTEQSTDTQFDEISPQQMITLEELKKTCRPCKVVLADFIKKLQIQAPVESDASENDTSLDESVELPNIEKEEDKTPAPLNETEDEGKSVGIENSDKLSADTSSHVNHSKQELSDLPPDTTTVENTLKTDDCNEQKFFALEMNAEPKLTGKDISSEISEQKVSPMRVKRSEIKNEIKPVLKQTEVTAVKSDKSENSRTDQSKAETDNEKPSPIKSHIKMKRTGRKSIMSERESPKKPVIQEQQTARKTVPPLKIKVKGVKRKRYMVEPNPDSPVDETCAKPKPERKKKLKSGNKSESSDSEKHGKGHHHHHKKRNKSPNIDQKNKSDSFNQSPHNKQIKATDAYEANFLQFIQETNNKVEEQHVLPVSQIAAKNKSYKTGANSKTQKTTSNTHAMATHTETYTDVDIPQKIVTSVNAGYNSFVDPGIKFLCILCQLEYPSQESISKHFQDVHPGMSFTYKPMPDDTSQTEQLVPGQKPIPVSMMEKQNVTRYTYELL